MKVSEANVKQAVELLKVLIRLMRLMKLGHVLDQFELAVRNL